MRIGSGLPISLLVVEDNPDHRMLTERALREAGFVVRTAATGEDALDSIDGADLVLLDYRLPRMSGIDVLESIRARSGPPVVVVTGMGSEEIAVEALRGGAIDYIVKGPNYLSALPTAVERAWRTHDLASRAAELERLTLLVTSASDRGEIFPEIARGARRLLRADACRVFVLGESGLELEGIDGESRVESPRLAEAARTLLSKEEPTVHVDEPTDQLLVPLPGRTNGPVGVLAVMTDSPRRYLPEELQLATTFASFAGIAVANMTRLELEQSLVTKLQTMLDMRTKLVGSVSHELRTPLTSIVGFTGTMIQHWETLSDEDRREFIGKVSDHAKELDDLVDGLLSYATVEVGQLKVELDMVDLPAFLASTVDGLAPVLRGRRIKLETQPAEVLGDPALLRRILSNLLSNAVKYSPPGSPITVRNRVVDGESRIEVEDRGPGLTGEEATRVFEPFWRKEEAAVRGAGIGLSLVREYSRLMNGDTGVESEPGQGSIFFCSLRLADRSTAPKTGALTPGP